MYAWPYLIKPACFFQIWPGYIVSPFESFAGFPDGCLGRKAGHHVLTFIIPGRPGSRI